jgi:putative transposase
MEIEPFEEAKFYHIYNRGINGEDIFKESRNYDYFLKQYVKYCSPVLETYAYALLKNHFHFVVFVKPNVQIAAKDGDGIVRLNPSRQLSHFFNSYAQSINKAYKRTGSLLESPFERKWINEDSYLTNSIIYCHHNPQLHHFVTDFKDWSFTSYHTILQKDNTFVNTSRVINWFGCEEAFVKSHQLTSITPIGG